AVESRRAARDPRARPLPPESVRHVRRHDRPASRDSRRRRAADRIELLRHGGLVRPREGPLRGVPEDGGGIAAARGARRGRRLRHRGGRNELSFPDRARKRAPGAASDPHRRGGPVSATAPQLREALAEAIAFEPQGDPAGNLTLGRGRWEGGLLRVAFVDNRIASGSLGTVECQRLAALFSVASLERSAIVLYLDSAGARVSEGLKALVDFRALYRACLDAMLGCTRIAVILGRYCFGGASMLAHLAPRRLFQESTQLAMSGPSVIASASGVDPLDEMFRAMAQAALSPAARAQANPANSLWIPGDDVKAWIAQALAPVGDVPAALRARHDGLGTRLARGAASRPFEPVRRRDLEKIYPGGCEATESDGLI